MGGENIIFQLRLFILFKPNITRALLPGLWLLLLEPHKHMLIDWLLSD